MKEPPTIAARSVTFTPPKMNTFLIHWFFASRNTRINITIKAFGESDKQAKPVLFMMKHDHTLGQR